MPGLAAGKQNFLIAFTTGGEVFACPTASQPCNAARRLTFSLTATGGQPVEQPLSFYGPAGFLGQEQANIQIHPQTTAGAYRLSVGFSFQNSTFRNNQRLLVRLGPPTTSSPPPSDSVRRRLAHVRGAPSAFAPAAVPKLARGG